MYSFKGRVRYSEVGSDRKLTLGSLINYFQDCSTFHAEDLGIGFDCMEPKGQAWILSSWQIVIRRLPKLLEEIETGTWAYDFKGFYGMRNYCMKTAAGEMLACANSLWIFMDVQNGRPVRITPEQLAGYTCEERLPMNYAGRKLPMPAGMEPQEGILVQKHQIDTNNHMNNGQYVILAMDYLPENFEVEQMRAEYKISARLGDLIIPYTKVKDGTCTVGLCNQDGKPYAVVEFTQKEPGKDMEIC